MRLETPVIYFHPPAGAKYEAPIDVRVRFRGGMINEFYPAAEASVAVDMARIQDKMEAGVLTGLERRRAQQLRGRVAASGKACACTTPWSRRSPTTRSGSRRARCRPASVFMPAAGEGERYLFYRGVAHLDALLQTKLSCGQVRAARARAVSPGWMRRPLTLANVWLADIRADGVDRVPRARRASTLTQGPSPARSSARIKRFSDSRLHGRERANCCAPRCKRR